MYDPEFAVSGEETVRTAGGRGRGRNGQERRHGVDGFSGVRGRSRISVPTTKTTFVGGNGTRLGARTSEHGHHGASSMPSSRLRDAGSGGASRGWTSAVCGLTAGVCGRSGRRQAGRRGAVTSQKKNPKFAWRYSPDARDLDTSVRRAVFVEAPVAAPEREVEVPGRIDRLGMAFEGKMTSRVG